MEISSIKHLYGFEDGDTITPGMGVQIDAGYGLQQYYDPATGNVTATKFDEHPAILFPQCYSSKMGSIIVPETQGQQWYYNNISDNAGILDAGGAVKAAYQDLFAVQTITMNGSTFPALRIKGNLVNANNRDFTDKRIYYRSTYRGMQITCEQVIPVQSAVGDAYNILLSIVGDNGVGDNVLSNDNDWVQYTAYLQLAGNTVADATFVFQRNKGNGWTNITNQTGVTEISNNVLRIFEAAVDGSEMFRVVATLNNRQYIKTFEVTDIHDPLYILDGCTISGDTVKPGETAAFHPKVYRRDNGEEETGFTFSYVIMRREDASVINNFGINELTYANISSVGGIIVRITASRS